MASAAQNKARVNFKKAIAYRKKTGCSLKEAFAHVKGGKVGAAKKKAPKKKAAVKKVAKKTLKYQGVIKKKSGNEYAYKLGNVNSSKLEAIKKYAAFIEAETLTKNALNSQKNKLKNNNLDTFEKAQTKMFISELQKTLIAIKKQKTIQKTLI